MTTVSNPNVRTVVQDVADRAGYGGYHTQIEFITASIANGASQDEVKYSLTAYGISPARAEQIVGEVYGSLGATVTTTDGFNRQQAADLIRVMLTEHDHHYTVAEVDALLVIAGLEDEPEPEPVVEPEPQGTLWERLVTWAQSHGFTG